MRSQAGKKAAAASLSEQLDVVHALTEYRLRVIVECGPTTLSNLSLGVMFYVALY